VLLIESLTMTAAEKVQGQKKRRIRKRRRTTSELFFAGHDVTTGDIRKADRVWLVWFRFVGVAATILIIIALFRLDDVADDIRAITREVEMRTDALTLPTFEVPLTEEDEVPAAASAVAVEEEEDPDGE
jgi:hypothetical protein